MADWGTIVSRIGQLAGGLDTAIDTKEARQAKSRYDRWKDIETLKARYLPAMMQEQGRDRRHTERMTFDAAKFGNKPATWSDYGKANEFVKSYIDHSGIFADQFTGEGGEISELASGPRAELIDTLRSGIASNPDLMRDPAKARAWAERTIQALGPEFKTDRDANFFLPEIWEGRINPRLEFKGPEGDNMRRIRRGLQSISGQARLKKLAEIRAQLQQKYPPNVANYILRQITRGL
ncbi:MAG: hypothetical protein Unbinned1190contig1000_50 [Prokaryotic dsDNA virus sp.]|nr:MAG: hypothetical protein Unbinned1190contig1000_50 [Prokaryotic dsDNA virus sp.]|tara:strand:- start:5386 stop:6093 length:708 start_codon:yes stop_codon:yes gene_type:complete